MENADIHLGTSSPCRKNKEVTRGKPNAPQSMHINRNKALGKVESYKKARLYNSTIIPI